MSYTYHCSTQSAAEFKDLATVDLCEKVQDRTTWKALNWLL